MNKTVRRCVILILAVVLVGSLARVAWQLVQYRKGEDAYSEAEDLVDLPDLSAIAQPDASGSSASGEAAPVYIDPYADELRNMDFTALREVNPEVLGWILIPGTVVSYPLLQHSDNDYYLTHTWKTWSSIVGSIFLECRNSADLSDFNTVIYGHNMNNGSMFGCLRQYKSQSFWKSHPYVYITTDAGSRCYEIFAAYEVSTAGSTYQIGFAGETDRQAFLDFCMGQSVIDTGVTPTVRDSILTLSTCTGRGHATRWVIQAVLKNTAASDEAAAAESGATAPDAQPDGSAVPDSGSAASSSAGTPDTDAAAGSAAPDASAPASESAAAPDSGTTEPDSPAASAILPETEETEETQTGAGSAPAA